MIEIWEPHWMSNSVYIATHKVKDGDNLIRFTKAKLPDLLMDGHEIRKYPITTNGKIAVFKVPLKDFTNAPTKQEILF